MLKKSGGKAKEVDRKREGGKKVWIGRENKRKEGKCRKMEGESR